MRSLVLATLSATLLTLGLTGCAAVASTDSPDPSTSACTTSVRGAEIAYTAADGRVLRVTARPGAVPEDVTAAMARSVPGVRPEWLNVAPEGGCLLASVTGAGQDCQDDPCLALVSPDLSAVEPIRRGGAAVHADGFAAVARGGELVVYSSGGGPHARDLWAVRRDSDGWGPPVLLTGASSYAWNAQPAIARDGARVLFDCGREPYGAEGTAICEVRTDGSSVRVVLSPAQSPAGLPRRGALHHPAYAPDGAIVFEADWSGEQIWRLPAGGGAPERVAPKLTNDNSPCVLADGRVVSLWIAPEDRDGRHRLKLAAPDGTTLVPDLLGAGHDVRDIGIGCGG
jgi:hypothetical protein